MRLAHPEWLWPLGLVFAATGVALLVALLVARRRRALLLGPAGGRVVHAALRSDLALLVALAAIGVALLGPRIGERVVRVPATGVDVVFALDVSHSMDAKDVPPTRLDRARRAVAELLSRLEPRDRVGLLAFASAGVLLAPLTPDRDVLLELLSGVDTDLLRPASSDLGAGVRAALLAFEAGSERPRLLVVLSDGEDPERRRDLAAAEAARAGVRVVALGFGSEAGATIPDHGVPLVDRSGRTVVTRRDLERLASLAAATDGATFGADTWGSVDFDAVTAALRRDAGKASGELVERRVRAVRVLPFALLAFVLLMGEGLPRGSIRLRRGMRRRSRRAVEAAVAGAVVLCALPSPAGDDDPVVVLEARVRANPQDPAALVALGAARLERGQRAAAARAFLAAAVRARDPKTASLAYFDLGITHLEDADLVSARDAFLDALALDPRHERARFNLEWTLLALAEQPAPPREIPQPEPQPSEPEPAALPPEQVSESAPGEGPEEPPPPREPPPMTEERRERLLERIEDDPAHALRSAAREAREDVPGGVRAW